MNLNGEDFTIVSNNRFKVDYELIMIHGKVLNPMLEDGIKEDFSIRIHVLETVHFITSLEGRF